MDTAQVVGETGVVSEPLAVRLAPTLLGPFPVTVAEAYAAVKDKLEPGVRYDIAFLNDDGRILRRFSRKTPREAWLMARPIDDDGRTLHSEGRVVFPLAFDAHPDLVDQDDAAMLEQWLVTQLEALKVADSDA